MGNERGFLGARAAAGAAHSIRGAGESGAGAIFVSAEVGWRAGISGDAGGCVSAGIPGEDSELLELAFVGYYGRAIDVGWSCADVYFGRLVVRTLAASLPPPRARIGPRAWFPFPPAQIARPRP